ncbi:MAG: T9SS type A sorting domain-containing protein [Candidatus Cloacimonadota bacterium]|nr:T9SS type A sorting domain-containing protein [Candidatus Cloacimonadota bacterium]
MKKYLFSCLIFILLIPSFLIAQEGLPNLIGIANASNSGNSSDDRDLRLNPPQNLQAVVTGNDVALTWDSPEGVDLKRDLIRYNLYRNHNIIAVVYHPTTYFNDNDLDNGVYVYYVTAVYDQGESDPSNTVSVVLGDNPSAMIPDIPAHSATDISIPLTVNGLINFFAMNITIEFNESILDSADATLIGGILENEDYDLEVNTSVDGVIGLQFNANADWFTGSGVVAYLEFYVVGSSDDSTPLTFTQFDVNEVSFLDDVTNGSVDIWGNPSAILPDTLTSPDTDISIPLTVSSLINLSEMNIIIEFNDNVIGSPDATLMGGILESENYDLNVDTSVDGVVELVFIANEDLFTGSGIVAYLGFTVIGICGDSTSLIFTQCDVNNINYLTDVVNGSVRIPFPSPQNLQADVSGNDVLLSWEPPEPIPTSDLLMYKVYRNDYLIAVVYIPATEFNDIGLENGTYNYYVTAVYEDGESDPSNLVEVTIPCVGVNDEITDSHPILLKQNYPNPFSTSTTISFSATDLHRSAQIKIYNIKGQLVKNFEFRIPNSELIKVVWDGRDENGKELSNGIYFYKLSTEDKTIVKRMIILR